MTGAHGDGTGGIGWLYPLVGAELSTNATPIFLLSLLLSMLLGTTSAGVDQDQGVEDLAELLAREWRFGNARRPGTRYYTFENVSTEIAKDGSRGAPTTYRLWIEVRAVADKQGGPIAIRCVCRKATITKSEERPRNIPAFKDYEYELHLGIDDEQQVFGIQHEDFNGLVDDADIPLNLMEGFSLYGSFIDFHMFDSFTTESQGEFKSDLSGLRTIGQHHTADIGVEVPVHLEPDILEGSKFKNGSISIAFKGMTLADGVPCALIGIGSRDSSFDLILSPQPGRKMNVKGGSVYSGDLSLELDSQWMSRLEFREFVVSKVTMGPQEIDNFVSERRVRIQSVSQEVFRKEFE